MITHNYHTHTYRCGHAGGTDEELVKAAIMAGLQVLGFSDHAPYRLSCPFERMDYAQLPEYIASVTGLKRKYAARIRILLGMELEYYPSQWADLADYRRKLDYCLLGQHRLSYEGYSSYDIHDPSRLFQYVDALEAACKADLCDCIAHPDVAMLGYPSVTDGSARRAAQRIAAISKRYGVPLELNCGGTGYGELPYPDGSRYPYPTRVFFEEFAKAHCQIIVGLDIHDPRSFLTDEYLNRALSVVKGLDADIIDGYDIAAAAAIRKKRSFR